MKFGYTLIYVDDVKMSLEFYVKAFGCEILFLHESLQYGELKTGETTLGFVHHDTASSHGFDYLKSNVTDRPYGFEIGWVTDNVAVAYDQAIRAGAVPVCPPNLKPWGQTVAYVRDCNGILVELCSPVG